MSKAVSQAWKRIEQWLSQNTPQLLKNLQAGATGNAIEQAEDQLEVYLPEDVKASYRIHNGQIDGSAGLINGWCLLSLSEILNQWNCWIELYREGEAEWHPLWIPITHNYGGDHYCLDLDPSLDQEIGRIIFTFHETVPEIEEVIASSFQDFLTKFADDLESGEYVFSEEENTLVESYDF